MSRRTVFRRGMNVLKEFTLKGTEVTASATELNYLASVTAGTPGASQVLVTSSGTALGDIYFTGNTSVGGTIDMTGAVELAGTAMTASAAELNYLDGAGGGTAVASKALVLDASKQVNELTISGTVNAASAFQLAGTAVTATAAEINKVAGVTAGTSTASKALVLGASKETDTFVVSGLFTESGTANFSGAVQLAGTAMTASAAELNFNDGPTAGVATASKTLVLGGSKDVDTLVVTGLFTESGTANFSGAIQIDANAMTADAAELNVLDGAFAGTAVANKAVVLGATKNINEFDVTGTATVSGLLSSTGTADFTGAWQVASVAVTSSAAELNFLDGSGAGTAVASKAVVLGAAKDLNELTVTGTATVSGILTASGTANFTGGVQLAGTAMTATADEINTLAGVTAGLSSTSKALVIGTSYDVDLLKVTDTFTAPSGRWTAGTAEPGSPSVGVVSDIQWNNNPGSGTAIGWVCIEAGTPGTWKGFGTISA